MGFGRQWIKKEVGTYFDEMNDWCFGILSDGSAPDSSNEVRLSVGSTDDQLQLDSRATATS